MRPDLSDRVLIRLLGGAALVLVCYFTFVRPVLPASWRTPGSEPLYLTGAFGALLLLVSLGFVAVKRGGRGDLAPAWFVAHVVCATVGTVLVAVHSAGYLRRPAALLLVALLGLIALGVRARLGIAPRIAATFATKQAGFVPAVPGSRRVLAALIERKRGLLASIDAEASEATFSPTLAHWWKAPLATLRYARLAHEEMRMIGARKSVGLEQAWWRPLHMALAWLFVLGVPIHVLTVTFFAGYVAGGEPITWWYLAAWERAGDGRLALMIDLERCTGCKSCEAACKQEHRLGPGEYRNKVVWSGDATEPPLAFLTLACQHCERPACLRACPVNPKAIIEGSGDGRGAASRRALHRLRRVRHRLPLRRDGLRRRRPPRGEMRPLRRAPRARARPPPAQACARRTRYRFGHARASCSRARGPRAASRATTTTSCSAPRPSTSSALARRRDARGATRRSASGSVVPDARAAVSLWRRAERAQADRVVPGGCNICFNCCTTNFHFRGDELVKITGNDDDPLLRGRVCPKSQLTLQLYHNRTGCCLRRSASARAAKAASSAFLGAALDEIAAKIEGVRRSIGRRGASDFHRHAHRDARLAGLHAPVRADVGNAQQRGHRPVLRERQERRLRADPGAHRLRQQLHAGGHRLGASCTSTSATTRPRRARCTSAWSTTGG